MSWHPLVVCLCRKWIESVDEALECSGEVVAHHLMVLLAEIVVKSIQESHLVVRWLNLALMYLLFV